jgi:hypothetical protein
MYIQIYIHPFIKPSLRQQTFALVRGCPELQHPHRGFCPLRSWQAHGGEFANFTARPRMHTFVLNTELVTYNYIHKRNNNYT